MARVHAGPELRVNQEEVFGPFVTLATFDSDEEAVAVADSTSYGREMGFEAMHGYTDPKSVWVNVDATLPPFYQRDQ